ncbi:MAG: TolC family protein [Bacteroidota bacterium]|nr:TolC family protein [Bacteroidota bacterium]
MSSRITNKIAVIITAGLFLQGVLQVLKAQDNRSFIGDSATVEECIRYAFTNQPLVKQLKLDEDISRQNVRIALSDWFPHIDFTGSLSHYLKQPQVYFPDITNPSGPKRLITTGVENNSSLNFSANQTIFNNDVYIAGTTVKDFRKQASQTTREAMIDLVVQINKAYYDVLLSTGQLRIINEDIGRLQESLHDSYVLYQNGINDNIDFKRATIALNNALAGRKSAEESIKGKISFLKQLMGYPDDKPLALKYDIGSLQKEVLVDTLQQVNYNNRIEYQLLQTNLKLQKANVEYNRLSLLPSLSAFGNYNFNYQNDDFSNLYKDVFPSSSVGLSLAFPIFQGTRRIQEVRKAKFQFERLSIDTLRLKDEINTQYVQALADYKSNLAAYRATRKNTDIATEVYNTVKLQYVQGIKTYLEVIVAESDLVSARINNLNALFMLMFARLDVDKAFGRISPDY